MNRALLDTDIYSEILKGINQTVKANAIAYRTLHGVLTLSAVTLMEITQGHYQKQALRQLQHFLASVAVEDVLPFDRDTAELAGRIAGELERIGQPIGTADPMSESDSTPRRVSSRPAACSASRPGRGASRRASEPTGHRHLLLRVELHPFDPLDMQVAEERLVPPGEREPGHRRVRRR